MSYRKHAEFRKMLREAATKDSLPRDAAKPLTPKPKAANDLREMPTIPEVSRHPAKYRPAPINERVQTSDLVSGYGKIQEKRERSVSAERKYQRDEENCSECAREQVRKASPLKAPLEQKQIFHEERSKQNGFHEARRAASTRSSELRRADHSNERCMCQICTCNRPDHLCPINYNRPGGIGVTEHKAEYVKRSADKPVIWKAEDNLRSKEGPTGDTIYHKDFNRKNATGPRTDNNLLVNTIVENNMKSHIKNLMGLPENEPRRAASHEPMDIYSKPPEYIKPAYKPTTNGKLEKKTVYTKDFVPFKGDYEGFQRVNYDNLQSYNPDVKFGGNTVYRVEHNLKQNSKPINDELGTMIREQNKYTHVITPPMEMNKKTEYKDEFWKKRVEQHHCPILDLPPVESQHRRMHGHIFYNDKLYNWHHHQY